MISAWMAYAFLVGALAAAAAWILEGLLRSHKCPVRWVWLGGLGLSALWPVWTALRPETDTAVVGPPPISPLVALEPLTLQVGSTSIWMMLDRPLVVFWILCSSALLLVGLGTLLRTRLLRSGWRGDRAVGKEVLISENWGPAVVGLFRPQIVLPEWCKGMDEDGLRLILDHESEHLKAGDLRLLALAGVIPILMPWSLPAWWMWYRVRLAVEGDCDLRVLRRNPRATRAYLELLLEVGRRMPQGRVAAAMLSEPERTLARRIRTMTMPIPKKPLLRAILLAGVGLILIAVACAVPTPTVLEEEAVLEQANAAVEVPSAEISALAKEFLDEPTFTPFTVRPDIKNRNEIVAALESEYPPLLRDAGVTGTASVWIFLDETGLVRKTTINESSGHPALDDAALRVAEAIQFTPALNRDKPVPVWIALPISFTVSDGERADAPAEKPASRTDAQDISQSPTFTPFTVRPDIKNRTEVAQALEREYPPLLRDAGIGGTVHVWFFIDDTGNPQRVLVNESSGHEALDEAALGVGRQIEFTPALNGDQRVPVWISLPITFTTR